MDTNQNKRVLIAGATGYLGGCLLTALKEQGYWVRVLIRNMNQCSKVAIADDIFIGEITKPETLVGITETIDYIYSTIGITRQKDGLTYMDVDYQGNMNLLYEAKKTDVKRFLYVSAINGDRFKKLKIFEAKEGFVDQLKLSGLDYRIVRPNGFFSDMKDFLEMAKSGRVYLFGRGEKRLNPIAGEDLAKVCITKMEGEELESTVGGPSIMSQRDIAVLALQVLKKPIRIINLPDFVRVFIIWFLRTFTSSKYYGPYEFFLTTMAYDCIAPRYGVLQLEDYYKKIIV